MRGRDLIDFYSAIVEEYEDAYDEAELQPHLEAIERYLRGIVAERSVLEVACGTGYWTRRMLPPVDRLVGLDASRRVLEAARSETPAGVAISYVQADAYRLPVRPGWDVGVAAFWWSHVPADRLTTFLQGFHETLGPGATVCFVDNRPREGFSPDGVDADGNSFVRRELDDGTTCRLYKRFPSEDDLRERLRPYTGSINYREFGPFWAVDYEPSDPG